MNIKKETKFKQKALGILFNFDDSHTYINLYFNIPIRYSHFKFINGCLAITKNIKDRLNCSENKTLIRNCITQDIIYVSMTLGTHVIIYLDIHM